MLKDFVIALFSAGFFVLTAIMAAELIMGGSNGTVVSGLVVGFIGCAVSVS